ncbi:galactan 5-O-arabinofuranosyltransferase [Corynebacterium sp. p3-SID1056]|uniref:galactan 5-O-arabinofuranosyltransferase n=1 Tax=Corynebacterium sp. p3-SID1056 TaxID=2916092 RepID=UPI0021A2D0BE|nr:galactan 5-O-arabinofuranosyltransferase [Corynebacterium sp. p3-SID1056]MCT2338079.1 galactan 5-O-arabinofuranosyltransferase [Corynebacterium sp. p3-SID1056]
MSTTASVEETRADLRTTGYAPDPISAQQTLIRTLLAGGIGALATTLVWFVMHAISLPAYNTSMAIRALSSAGSILVLIVTLICAVFWLRGTRKWLNGIVMHLTAPALVVTSLGIPLSATRLWLDGIQVDQGFRTQFLSRMTETAGNADMNYADLPSFYPMGWFWLGGRVADLLGVPGWEVFQPWALITLAAGAAMLVPVWQKITGSLPVACVIATFTTAVVLTETPDEPYAAIVAMFFPAATVITYRALLGSRNAIIFMALYLGISASLYTLFTAIAALFVVTMSVLVFFVVTRDAGPFIRLLIIGVSSLAIAAVTWWRYLAAALSGNYDVQSTANHFLPEEGTVFPLPFFSFSIIGLLSLLGLILIVIRAGEREVASLGVGIIVCYAWCLASMAATLLGTSLLGFRVEVLIIELFVTAGILAVTDIILVGLDYFFPTRFNLAMNQTIIAIICIVVASACLQYVQQIPAENESHIDQAYADTDGFGERADRFPPDAAQYYGEITELLESHDHHPNEAVIYTDEINYMAYNPYFGFNAFTSHYANPLGEFALRNEELIAWSQLSWDDPAALTGAIEDSKWAPPVAFIFRGDVEEPGEGFKTHVAHDIFPNEPNVRYEGLFFNAEAFEGDEWHVEQIGPFAVVVRT